MDEYSFIMDYVKSGNLQSYLSNDFKNLKWNDKISILYDIICGLKEIHKQNFIHRNIHSGNILQQKNFYSIFSISFKLSYGIHWR